MSCKRHDTIRYDRTSLHGVQRRYENGAVAIGAAERADLQLGEISAGSGDLISLVLHRRVEAQGRVGGRYVRKKVTRAWLNVRAPVNSSRRRDGGSGALVLDHADPAKKELIVRDRALHVGEDAVAVEVCSDDRGRCGANNIIGKSWGNRQNAQGDKRMELHR